MNYIYFDPRKKEISARLDAIIDRLNELNAEEQDMRYGVADLELALDIRADTWDGEGDCPDPTPEEIESIKAEIKRLEEIDAETSVLISEYYGYTHTSPYRYELGGNYARRWKEEIYLD